jgi:oxalate decarboxylase
LTVPSGVPSRNGSRSQIADVIAKARSAGRMTIFNTGPNTLTTDFNPGDVGYVKKNLGHYIQNTGDTDLQVLEVFKAPRFMDVSLSD